MLGTHPVSGSGTGWITVTDDVADDLAQYRAQKDREAFLNIAKTLKGFGSQCFGETVTSFPEPNSKCTVFLGNSELLFQSEDDKEWRFQVSRMRCM